MPEETTSIQHIAFIPDGNRRWSRDHKIRQLFGHRIGFDVIRRSYDWFRKYNIKYATFFAFSVENWNRSKIEIDYLLNLFRSLFDEAIKEFPEKGIRFRCIGDLGRFPQDIRDKMNHLIEVTSKNDTWNLTVAIGYSGRDEMVRAAKKIAEDVVNHRIELTDISESLMSTYLDTKDIPEPDIIVRTSEQRISNFMLWQLAYSEIFFVDKYWPDFNEEDFDKIVEEFSHRVRRYGA